MQMIRALWSRLAAGRSGGGESVLIALLVILSLLGTTHFVSAQVTAVSEGSELVVSNGVLGAVFDLDKGDMVSLRTASGGELLGHGGKGYFLAATPGSSRNLRGAEFRFVRRQKESVEIAFTRRFADVAFELHYVVRAGESGLYVFLIQSHRAAMEPFRIEQTGYTLRVDPRRFNYAFTSETKFGPLVTPETLQKGTIIQDATYRLADGTVYTKYDWADSWDHHWGHGLTGPTNGMWIIPGGRDYLVGGPTKQELFVHATDTTPVMMQIFVGAHFLGDEDGEPPVTGDWAKLSGPVFIYVNSGDSPAAMMEDAKRRAARLDEAWPYRWMDNPLYPLQRGTVTGRLRLSEGASAGNATVILAAPSPDWQKQWSTYNFWTHADADGSFVVPKVRPGSYTLYGIVRGVPGEFRRDQVVVKAGETNQLGTLDWTPPSNGRLIWQIGVADRSAGEFRHGGEPRQYGLWNRYPADFPNDVDFNIGRSREAEDWNYVQPVLSKPGGGFHQPVWNIHFNLPDVPRGHATLELAIAGVYGSARIEALVNGAAAGFVTLSNDSSVRRSANQAGWYRLRLVRFDAKLLHAGANTIGLRLSTTLPDDNEPRDHPIAAVMYDCVRLELQPDGGN